MPGSQIAAIHPRDPARGRHSTANDLSDSAARDAATEALFRRAGLAANQAERQSCLDEVVLLNGAVAEAIARRYRDRGVELDDLVQVAYLGLVKAAHGYRPGEGPGFLAYAVPTIAGEIKRHFRDYGWMVRPPRRVQELRGNAAAKVAHLHQECGRPPTAAEVAAALGVPVRELDEAALADGCFRALSLDSPCPGDTTLVLADLLVSDDRAFDQVVTVESLRPALLALGERDRLILGLRYVDGWTQERIGQEIGVSQMQVSRLLSRILATLRRQLGGIASAS